MADRREEQSRAKRGETNYVLSGYLKSRRWACPDSPTGAHYWDIKDRKGRCRYCLAGRDFTWEHRSSWKED